MYIPFCLAAGVLLAALAVITIQTLQANAGHLIYTLDDPYIHMAIAKNLVEHGIFGATRFGFSSSTSSPLWTLILAFAYGIFGASDWTPGILATLFALAALYVTDSVCRLVGVSGFWRFIACLAVAYFTPLLPLVSTGMEHSMHLFLALVLIRETARFMLRGGRTPLVSMCLAGLFATAARYESLFLVGPIALYLFCNRQRRAALALVAASCLPVFAYGAYSMLHGSFFLPNSLMLKGRFHRVDRIASLVDALGYYGIRRLAGIAHLRAMCIALLTGALLFGRGTWLRPIALGLVVSIVLHLQFASAGWFYRYEAYLVGTAIPLAAGLYLGRPRSPLLRGLDNRMRLIGVVLLLGFVVFLSWPLQKRAKASLQNIVRASNHIYRQQYHMATFLRTMYPPGVRVACNDLGAISYYTDADILDLWGLGTIEIARAKRSGSYDTHVMEQLLKERQTEVVLVHSRWFTGKKSMPESLIPVADWITTRSFFRKTVTFYALSRTQAEGLQERLRRYQGNLPDSVEVNYHPL